MEQPPEPVGHEGLTEEQIRAATVGEPRVRGGPIELVDWKCNPRGGNDPIQRPAFFRTNHKALPSRCRPVRPSGLRQNNRNANWSDAS